MRKQLSIFNFPPAFAFGQSRWRAGQLAIEKGFTLIELLVSIAILGVLTAAAAMVINPVAQFQKGYDARRKTDLGQIQRALEVYYQDNRAYPDTSGSPNYYIKTTDADDPIKEWGLSWTPYMGNLPKDPGSSKKYIYYSNGQSYYLYASLDRGANDAQACNGGSACVSLAVNNIPANTCASGTIVCNYGVSSPNVNP